MMKKRLFAAAMSAVMLTAMLGGCQSAPAGDGGTTGGTTGETIKIGGLAPLTGEVSVYGIATNNGVKMAVEDINKAGGVLGKQIEYMPLDEKGDETEATNAYNRLVEQGIVGLVGDVTTNPCLAVAQASQADNMPMITGTGTGAAITAAGPNVFRTCFTDPYQGKLMANYASKKLGAKTAAMLYDMSDNYSSGVAEAFKAAAGELGMTIVAEEKYQGGDVDFKSQLTNIKSKNPDILFVPVYYQDLSLIAVQVKQLGIPSRMMGVDGWDGVLDKIDKSNVDALKDGLFCSQYSAESTDEAVQNFIKTYNEKYKSAPNMFAVLGYDSMQILAAAINKAGSTDKDAIIKAMTETDHKGLTGQITFDAERNPVKSAVIMTIQDGAYKYVENFDI